jgi:hypothetical protein
MAQGRGEHVTHAGKQGKLEKLEKLERVDLGAQDVAFMMIASVTRSVMSLAIEAAIRCLGGLKPTTFCGVVDVEVATWSQCGTDEGCHGLT